MGCSPMPDKNWFGEAISKQFAIVARFYAEAGFFMEFISKLKCRL
ncbi:hypothetical protein BN8_03750 [Fibrisoma limi BUZ 3]|uniref:Uncharacterized protein n=1 Tax=Fibrisoma limi BUZ 3 TaxID=1185876 RepID=I2GKZ2_9BACT|nr:hypothetical protein BN8_03750 [Fibrisoma limi BUZ 3]